MNAADSTRRSKKEIADALKAQIAPLLLAVNLVPANSVYDAQGNFSLTGLAAGDVYTFTPGANEDGAADTFTATAQPQILSGTANAAVTAVVSPLLFQRIETFDIESLTDAFKILMLGEQRICVIVMLDETFEATIEQPKLFVTRQQPVALLISDRDLGDRVKALWGDPADATVPGAFALAEFVLPQVTGQLISAQPGKGGVLSEPKNLYSLFLTEEDRKELPGRAAVSLELLCRGGTLETTTDPGPTL